MSEHISDAQREILIRTSQAVPGYETRERFLLRLLDAERARADAAEWKADCAWTDGYNQAVAAGRDAASGTSEGLA